MGCVSVNAKSILRPQLPLLSCLGLFLLFCAEPAGAARIGGDEVEASQHEHGDLAEVPLMLSGTSVGEIENKGGDMEYCWISWNVCSTINRKDVMLAAVPPTKIDGQPAVQINWSEYDCLAVIQKNKKSRCLKHIIQHKYQTTYQNCKDNVKKEMWYMEKCFVEQKLGDMTDVFATFLSS
mmetsp:Transcript_85451/g.169533  ORF Transcript_85451/g.169533 Transcript_85451/m.169533 type:complete len:180 (-) Transcript_85451:156-695(-)